MSSTTLKIIALILMLLDHIATFIPGAPIWLKWIGRISAPLFIFTMVWGLHYTKDRIKYLKNMYYWGVGMSIGDVIVSTLVTNAHSMASNNIFVTLFLIGLFSTMIEMFINKENKKGYILLTGIILVQVIGLALIPVVQSLLPRIPTAYFIVAAIFPNLLHCEGMFVVVILGVGMYFAKRLPSVKFSIVYITLSLLMFMSQDVSFTINGLFKENYQWMMVFALPFMLMYNGKKGANLKYLFYVFYPAHVYILCYLGSIISFKS